MHNPMKLNQLRNQLNRLLNKISHWKIVYANWQLGTRDNTDGAFKAIQDAKELSLRNSIKMNAIVSLLTKKGLISEEGFLEEQINSANKLEQVLEAKFPGAVATDDGMEYNEIVFKNTKDNLGFPI